MSPAVDTAPSSRLDLSPGSTPRLVTLSTIAGESIGSQYDLVVVTHHRLGYRQLQRQPLSGQLVGSTWASKPGGYRDFEGSEFGYRLVGRARLVALAIDDAGTVRSDFDVVDRVEDFDRLGDHPLPLRFGLGL